MDAYMVHVSVHGSGLILHGSFSSQVLQGLDDNFTSSMVIDRFAGCFKCHFQIFVKLQIFLSWPWCHEW